MELQLGQVRNLTKNKNKQFKPKNLSRDPQSQFKNVESQSLKEMSELLHILTPTTTRHLFLVRHAEFIEDLVLTPTGISLFIIIYYYFKLIL
jgi:hypothetical protein